jgi:hypothetical protein
MRRSFRLGGGCGKEGTIKTGKVSEGTIATAGDRMFNSVNVKTGNGIKGQDEHPTQKVRIFKATSGPVCVSLS